MPVLLAAALLGLSRLSEVESLSIKPSETDPAITQFDNAHRVYIDRAAPSKGQLLLFLPGTNGKPGGEVKFCTVAAQLGFPVVNLMYPDTTAAASLNRSTDRDAMLNFRLEIIEGKDLSSSVSVDRPNSIENRLIKLLRYLDSHRPGEHWADYLTKQGDIDWRRIIVSGLSQGAGHAALIAVKHQVARAIYFGGPKDYDRATHSPADWLSLKSATSPSVMYAFNHKQDRQGCTYAEQIENCKAFGLTRFGAPCDVEGKEPPFGGSHVLFTNYPGTTLPSIQAHTSVVGDRSTPTAPDGSPLFKPVWIYMLTNQAKG